VLLCGERISLNIFVNPDALSFMIRSVVHSVSLSIIYRSTSGATKDSACY